MSAFTTNSLIPIFNVMRFGKKVNRATLSSAPRSKRQIWIKRYLDLFLVCSCLAQIIVPAIFVGGYSKLFSLAESQGTQAFGVDTQYQDIIYSVVPLAANFLFSLRFTPLWRKRYTFIILESLNCATAIYICALLYVGIVAAEVGLAWFWIYIWMYLFPTLGALITGIWLEVSRARDMRLYNPVQHQQQLETRHLEVNEERMAHSPMGLLDQEFALQWRQSQDRDRPRVTMPDLSLMQISPENSQRQDIRIVISSEQPQFLHAYSFSPTLLFWQHPTRSYDVWFLLCIGFIFSPAYLVAAVVLESRYPWPFESATDGSNSLVPPRNAFWGFAVDIVASTSTIIFMIFWRYYTRRRLLNPSLWMLFLVLCLSLWTLAAFQIMDALAKYFGIPGETYNALNGFFAVEIVFFVFMSKIFLVDIWYWYCFLRSCWRNKVKLDNNP